MSIKPNTWSCIEIRMKDELTIQTLKIVPLEVCKGSNYWEQRYFAGISIDMKTKSGEFYLE
jgi:hypothetical protein